jgi:excisionase family DNA binding protein
MSTDSKAPAAPSPTASQRNSAPGPRLLPARRASIETGIAYTTLRDVVFRGEIPVLKIGRAWYFDRRDLEQWIASHKERLS